MKKEQFEQITKWQRETFGKPNVKSSISHLCDEIEELIDAISQKDPNTRIEVADCFFLLYRTADACGMNYEDICNAIQEKFEINQKRKWGKPDERGVVKHVKD